MAEAFDITTQTSDEMPLHRGRGEVKFQITNRLGRSVRARIRVEPDGEQGARSDWLIVARPEHAFAPGGSTVVTVEVAVPAGTPPGRYPFRLVVAAQDVDGVEGNDSQDGQESRSAPVGLRHESSSRALWAALIIGAVVLAASGFGLYRWLAQPECAMERGVRDEAGQCGCPSGMIQTLIGDKSVCLCAAGTAYDQASGRCTPRSCEVERALYAEAADACSCPPGTLQAQVGDRARCVCPVGQKYDPATLACAAYPCTTPEHARYDERTEQCECPAGTEPQTRAETGGAVCACPGGLSFDDTIQRCITQPNLHVMWINVFPPLRLQRQFTFQTAIENNGGSPAGAFRVHLVASDAGVDFRHQIDVPALAPGEKLPYRSPPLRIEANQPLRIQVRIEAQGLAESSVDDNVLEKTFPLTKGKGEGGG